MNPIEYKKNMEVTGGYMSNMPSDIYHAHDSVSNSGLKLVNRSPAHFKRPPERTSTRAMVVGSALHMACLEPDLFYATYVLLDDAENRLCKEYKDQKKKCSEDLILVKSEIEKIEGITKSLYSNPEATKLLNQDGWNELSGFAHDAETGMICRHRFDKLTKKGLAIDLKTTTDARPNAFSRSIFNFGYHVQDAFYSDQYQWITGEELEGFAFIVVETESPYAVKVYYLGDESRNLGRETYRKALNTFAYCKDTKEWPSYNDEPEEINVPHWALRDYDESLINAMTFSGE